MNAATPRPPSCCRFSSSANPLCQLSTSKTTLLVLSLLFAPATHAQGTNPSPGDDGTDDNTGDSSMSANGMLNLYFLFIAIAVILLAVALLLLHRRKKRRKAMMRNNGQSALAQDINGPGAQQNSRWPYGNGRWMMGGGGPRTPEEGLNERGEAPPPYHQPPGGPPQPAYTAPFGGHYAPAGAAPVVAMPPMPPPPAAGWQSEAGLTIPMRTLSRDTQGNKPPDYQETLTGPPSGDGGDAGGPNNSTGNLLRHDGQYQGGTQR
ncbi:hypothetical protein BK809_0001932 [Diplodia seriata]|uniref:Uncharacterized protein n=1 Tax=Diplodia seriata TaxID=420778 RepID=A0A1S8BBC1_9PEZI|nr:hypothetical protein BK809_0001932 [Diplodia seriata]